jgi:hypothetical protein
MERPSYFGGGNGPNYVDHYYDTGSELDTGTKTENMSLKRGNTMAVFFAHTNNTSRNPSLLLVESIGRTSFRIGDTRKIKRKISPMS